MSVCGSDKGRGNEGGGHWLWHCAASNILSCLIHETQSCPWVTMAATLSHLCISLEYVELVCVWPVMIDSLTQPNQLCF